MGKINIELVKEAIKKATLHQSKLIPEVLNVPSFTSIKIRHLLNNLGSISTRYLECGTHLGGHFCSVCFDNRLEEAIAIDNYIEFNKSGETKERFLEYADLFVYPDTVFCLLEEDCFTVKGLGHSKFDLYNYDANHSESSQQRAVSHFLSNLTDEFIMVVDDWQFEGVERGTRNGIKLSGLEILFECILETKPIEHPNEAWHNGYSVFVLKQSR